jgi:hypothetical protein
MESLGDVNIRSAQTPTRKSRLNHSVEPEYWVDIRDLAASPALLESRIHPANAMRQGRALLRGDLVWRDPRPIKSDLGRDL